LAIAKSSIASGRGDSGALPFVFREKQFKYLEAVPDPLRVPSGAFSPRQIGAMAVNLTLTMMDGAVQLLSAVQFPSRNSHEHLPMSISSEGYNFGSNVGFSTLRGIHAEILLFGAVVLPARNDFWACSVVV